MGRPWSLEEIRQFPTMTGHKPFAKPVSLFSRRRTYQSDSDHQRLCLEHFWVEKKPNLFGLAPAGRQALAPKSRNDKSRIGRSESARSSRDMSSTAPGIRRALGGGMRAATCLSHVGRGAKGGGSVTLPTRRRWSLFAVAKRGRPVTLASQKSEGCKSIGQKSLPHKDFAVGSRKS